VTPLRRVRFVRRALAVLLGAPVAIGAGFVSLLYVQGHRAPGGSSEYVAMGSSFAAAPGVGRRVKGSPAPCARSDSNYAHLLARLRGLDLTDVTCSGSTTHSVLEGGQFFQPPQIDAVHANTKLVTVTIGGNDIFYMRNLIAWSCGNAPTQVPFLWRMGCRPASKELADEAWAELPARLTEIANQVHVRARDARLVFVDYLTVLPETGTCPALPLTSEQTVTARAVASRLDDVIQRVASQTHSDLVRASELTRGHDVCAAQPWVTGFHFLDFPLSWGPVAYHPTPEAMSAIAAEIDRLLSGA
jgi:hypothetical protein